MAKIDPYAQFETMCRMYEGLRRDSGGACHTATHLEQKMNIVSVTESFPKVLQRPAAYSRQFCSDLKIHEWPIQRALRRQALRFESICDFLRGQVFHKLRY